jgi:hypothetical protein
MKTKPSFAKFLAATLLASAIFVTPMARAGLQIPYAVDTNTIHLWHFDGATNTTLTTDEVLTASITLTNAAQTNVPGALSTLGATAAFPQLNTAYRNVATNLTTGNCNAFAYGGTNAVTNFVNPTTGAYTWEALINFDGNPAANPSTVNMEIISADGNVNGNNNRGWQFRVQSGAAPSLNFNAFPGNNAGVNNLIFPLPLTGPNALAASNWYHVALSYTGAAPTNGDTAGVLTLYWTLLDANRTNADTLLQTNVQAGFTLATAGIAQLGIGGAGRNFPGTIANGEGFKGLIDEVRMSIVARKPNEMAFTTGGSLNPPSFLSQPPSNTFIGYGKTLNLPTLVSGTLPIRFSWQQNTGSGFTNFTGQTNSTLTLSTTFASAGDYRLFATNSVGSRTSLVAHVTIGAAFNELFDTGLDAGGALALPNTFEVHYSLTHSADGANLGPSNVVWDMGAFPMAAQGGTFANIDGTSQWIGPLANVYTSPTGSYRYRTTFLLDSADLTQPLTLSGLWWVNTTGNDILLNGVSTGNPHPISGQPQQSANFAITNGFVRGLNTLEFVTTRNGGATESAVRVEMSGIGQALPPGLPVITNQPVVQTVRDANFGSGSSATFSVVALGRPPLSYQWVGDNLPIGGATNRTLKFTNPTAGGQAVNFKVIVSNDSGSVTSQVAALTLLSVNQLPTAPPSNFTIYSNNTLNIDLSTLFLSVTDADHDPLLIFSIDSSSTNGGSITQNNAILTYTPAPAFVGADGFTYSILDNIAITPLPIIVNVVPILTPTLSSATLAGTNLVLSGSGGATNGSYTVMTTTNITTPLTNWTAAGTGVFDGTGNFNFTNAVAPGTPMRFFVIRVP